MGTPSRGWRTERRGWWVAVCCLALAQRGFGTPPHPAQHTGHCLAEALTADLRADPSPTPTECPTASGDSGSSEGSAGETRTAEGSTTSSTGTEGAGAGAHGGGGTRVGSGEGGSARPPPASPPQDEVTDEQWVLQRLRLDGGWWRWRGPDELEATLWFSCWQRWVLTPSDVAATRAVAMPSAESPAPAAASHSATSSNATTPSKWSVGMDSTSGSSGDVGRTGTVEVAVSRGDTGDADVNAGWTVGDAAVVRCAAHCEVAECGAWLLARAVRARRGGGCQVGELCCYLESNATAGPRRECPAGDTAPDLANVGVTFAVGIPTEPRRLHPQRSAASSPPTTPTNTTAPPPTPREHAVAVLQARAAPPDTGAAGSSSSSSNVSACSGWRYGAPWRDRPPVPADSPGAVGQLNLGLAGLWDVLSGGVVGVGGAARAMGGRSRWEVAVDETGLEAHLAALAPTALTAVLFHAYWCPFSAGVFPLVAMLVADFPELSVRSVDAYTHHRLNARHAIVGYPMVVLFRGSTVLGKLLSPQDYPELAAFVAGKTGVRLPALPYNTAQQVNASAPVEVEGEPAGKGAAVAAAARLLVGLNAAIRDGDARRAVELQQLLRELSWYTHPWHTEGLPVPTDMMVHVGTLFAVTTLVYSLYWFRFLSRFLG